MILHWGIKNLQLHRFCINLSLLAVRYDDRQMLLNSCSAVIKIEISVKSKKKTERKKILNSGCL